MHEPILTSILNDHPNVRLILSTSWVRTFSYSNVLKRMPTQLAERVCGATWHSRMEERHAQRGHSCDFDRLGRFEQIVRHVNRHGVLHWVALDDLHSGEDFAHWPMKFREHLVLTNPNLGLSCLSTQAELRGKLTKCET